MTLDFFSISCPLPWNCLLFDPRLPLSPPPSVPLLLVLWPLVQVCDCCFAGFFSCQFSTDPFWSCHKHDPACLVLNFTLRLHRSWFLLCLYSVISRTSFFFQFNFHFILGYTISPSTYTPSSCKLSKMWTCPCMPAVVLCTVLFKVFYCNIKNVNFLCF